jgi:outer membrane cobalamin receptor
LNEGNKALFVSNTYNAFNPNTEGYTFGNSFGLVYDDVKTVSLFGELKADFSQKVAFSINGTLANYTTKTEQNAWNLPTVKLSSNFRYTISPKWETGANVFYVGQRTDREQYSFDGLITMNEEVQLDGYVDLNAHVNYNHSDRLTFFLKGNNLASQNYQKWLGFPVQGIQVLLGANFKFDF